MLGVDAIALAIVVFFFVAGLSDGTVSAYNSGIWAALLGGTFGVVIGGVLLRRSGRRVAANLVLALLAVPAGLLGLFFLSLIILQPRWQ
jgi:drug/metabolite transporter (DMT)-like permease